MDGSKIIFIFLLTLGLNVYGQEYVVYGKGETRMAARDDGLRIAVEKFLTKNVLDPTGKIREYVLKNPVDFIEQYWIHHTKKYSASSYVIRLKVIVSYKIHDVKLNDIKKFKDYSQTQNEGTDEVIVEGN